MEFDKKMEAKRCSTSWLWMLPISSDFDTNIKPIWAVKWYTETGVELKCKVQTDVDGNLTEMVIQINWKRLVKSMPKWRWQTQLTECVFCFFLLNCWCTKMAGPFLAWGLKWTRWIIWRTSASFQCRFQTKWRRYHVVSATPIFIEKTYRNSWREKSISNAFDYIYSTINLFCKWPLGALMNSIINSLVWYVAVRWLSRL